MTDAGGGTDPSADPHGRELAVQRAVARIALTGVESAGFALSGSGAIREHGVIDRHTEDVDLFTTSQDTEAFDRAVDRVITDLQSNGYQVEPGRRAALFARLRVSAANGIGLDVDLGVDWRESEPVRLEIGPVLSLDDAAGSKVAALYSRAEARDYLDVDAIRSDGRFTDEQLLAAAAERDPGFDLAMFTAQLDAASRLRPAQVARYSIDAAGLAEIQQRCARWAAQLRGRE